ncbi:MAG: hypothetical protein M0Q51_11820 [Bacteroidales bacterium]|nr:hypothetical protein [Bacteroidales bacterium]
MESNEQQSEKRIRFVKIAEKRVNYVLKYLDSLGNCANRRNYEYSDKDVKKIFFELDKKLKEIKNKFEGGESDKSVFKLDL